MSAVWVVREDRLQEGYSQTYRILTQECESENAWRAEWYWPGVIHGLTRAQANDMLSRLNAAPEMLEELEAARVAMGEAVRLLIRDGHLPSVGQIALERLDTIIAKMKVCGD